MAENTRPIGPGRRGMRGPRPKVEKPGLILKRLFRYVMHYNWLPLLAVGFFIIISTLANVQGTLFMKMCIRDRPRSVFPPRTWPSRRRCSPL